MYPSDTGRSWPITPDSSYPRRPAPGGSPCPSHSAPSLIAFQFSYDWSKFVNMKTPIHSRLIYDAKSHTWNSHMQKICNTHNISTYTVQIKALPYSNLNALTMCSLWRLSWKCSCMHSFPITVTLILARQNIQLRYRTNLCPWPFV